MVGQLLDEPMTAVLRYLARVEMDDRLATVPTVPGMAGTLLRLAGVGMITVHDELTNLGRREAAKLLPEYAEWRNAHAEREPDMGLWCELLVPVTGSCANEGLSNRPEVRRVILLDDRLAEMTADLKRRGRFPTRLWAPDADAPAVRLAQTTPGYVVARPVDAPAGAVGPMASGAYIVCRDERFTMLTGGDRPIPLHDRFETPELYRALSSD